MEEVDIFNYKIIDEKNICILVFEGVLSNKFQLQQEECVKKINTSKSEVFILKFDAVFRIEKSAHRFLVRLQNIIRNDLGGSLRICEIKPPWKLELFDTGIVKNKEYFNSLKEAITSNKLIQG